MKDRADRKERMKSERDIHTQIKQGWDGVPGENTASRTAAEEPAASRAEEYISVLTGQMRCIRARQGVREEITAHIEDQKESFLEEGYEEDQAEELAVREMGDPVEAGIELDRVHRPKMAWGMIGLIIAASIVGFVMRLAMRKELTEAAVSAVPAAQSFVFLLIGFALMMAVCYMDYSRIAAWAKELSAGLFLLVLAGVLLGGRSVNGATNWIAVGPLHLHIQMLLLLFVPLYGAIVYSYRGQGYRGILKAVVWMILPVATALRIPSTQTVILLYFTFVLILTAGVWKGFFRVARKKAVCVIWFLSLVLPGMFVGFLLYRGNGYQSDRLRFISQQIMYLVSGDTSAMFEQGSYTQMNLWRVISQSRLFGAGSVPDGALDLLSGDEFMLTWILAFYGIAAVLLFVVLLLFIFGRFARISLKQKNQLGMIMGFGCAVVFFAQILLHVFGNLTAVIGGAMCPFIMQGGTGNVVTYILLGFLLSIYRYQSVLPPQPRVGRRDSYIKIRRSRREI